MKINYTNGLVTINFKANEAEKAQKLARNIVIEGDSFVISFSGDTYISVRQTGFAARKEYISGLRILVNKCKQL